MNAFPLFAVILFVSMILVNFFFVYDHSRELEQIIFHAQQREQDLLERELYSLY